MAADHGEFAFRSPHQPMQICCLRRYACGKATGCKPPTVVEALGIGFDYKREEAFAQSSQSLSHPLPVTYIRQSNHNEKAGRERIGCVMKRSSIAEIMSDKQR